MRLRFPLFTAACFIGLAVAPAQAQLLGPRLNSIFPCGGRQATTTECAVAGTELSDATGLYFSHPGITAQPAGSGKFKVAVARDVPIGPYDVRVVSPAGLSNFRTFVVSDWPEVQEKEPNNDPINAQRVTLPVVVNGRTDGSADVDCYVFAAKKGQRVLINCWAWRLDSQLDGTLQVFGPDGKDLAYNGDYYGRDPFIDFTAPGDGDYTVKIWDFVYAGGTDYFYRLHIGSLPHIDAALPAAVRSGAKTTVTLVGRNLPGGKPAPDGMQIEGRPLEVITREIEAPADPERTLDLRTGEAIRPTQASLDGMAYRLTTPEGSSNPIFLAITNHTILVEKSSHHDLASAQRLPIPCDVTGTFGTVGDRDWYVFPAKKGEKLIVEIFAERQSGLIDPVLMGYDPAGKRLFLGDKGGAARNIGQLRFATNTLDTRWDFTAALSGDHAVQVRDLYFQQRGSARLTYRLSVRRPEPDFRLIVVPNDQIQPDAAAVGRGCRNWMDVLVFRQDGFDGPIQVEATKLPAGVTCAPVVIGPGKTSAPLVFHAAGDAPIGHAEIRVTGKALIDGKETVRVARGGGLTWRTVNTPGIARMADSIVLAVSNPSPFTLTATPSVARVTAGAKLPIVVKVERAANWGDAVQLSGFDLPQNCNIGLVSVAKNAAQGTAELTVPANMKPGTYTFTVTGAGQAPRDFACQPDTKRPRGANVRVVFPSNAITITVEAPR
jgi:hypothetical protein